MDISLKYDLYLLLTDQVDEFEVLSMASKYSVAVSNISIFSKQKLVLKKTLLEQMLRLDDIHKGFYERLLRETLSSLNPGANSKYSCCLAGCNKLALKLKV